MNDSKQEVLRRIREALKVPARAHHEASHAHSAGEIREWLPPVGDAFEQQAELFARNAAELRAEFHLTANEDEARRVLSDLARKEAWPEIASHNGTMARSALRDFPQPILWMEPGYSVDHLERCPAGVTECDALVAQTGSVLISSLSAGGRALSILPPHHVVLARREQMVSDLSAAYEIVRRKYSPRFPSLISFVTGPSRTGDIERILVLGAHGPKRLTIIVW